MSLHNFTPLQKAEALESVIDAMRRAKIDGVVLEILKAAAADFRARIKTPAPVLKMLQEHLDRIRQSRTALGYDQGRMITLAQHVMGAWPIISQALEQFEKEPAE